MSRSRTACVLFVGAACGFAAAAAGGETPRFLEPAPGARLETGTRVSVAWTAGVTAGAGLDEMELVLSLDGGRNFPLRVTRTLSPAARSYSWRVPDLPTGHARLALRAGREGHEESEAIRMITAEFAIVAGEDVSLEETFPVGGEWRTREALESPAAPPEPRALRLPEEEVRTAFGPDRAAEPPTSIAPAPDRARHGVETTVVLSASGSNVPSPDRSPASIPLRQ